MRTLLVTGRYEEAAESARELFERCTEAGMQVGRKSCSACARPTLTTGSPTPPLPPQLTSGVPPGSLVLDLEKAVVSASG